MKSEFFAGHLFCYPFMVEATGFEPAASASRTQRSTKLSHASIFNFFIPKFHEKFVSVGFYVVVAVFSDSFKKLFHR